MSVRRLISIGHFIPVFSLVTLFLATGLRPDPLEGDADKFLSVEAIPLDEVLRMAEGGKLRDAKTLASLMLAKRRLF